METPPSRSFIPPLAAVGIALGAVWYGGATERMAQALVMAAFGGLLVLAPVRRWPGRGFAFPAMGLLLLSVSGFLPANWFAVESWRAPVRGAGIVLPGTLSPQPWLTVESIILLCAGLAWIGWFMARPWDSRSRRITACTLAGGLIAIAVAALVAWMMGARVPGWLSERGFGPFPNRNHTGHVFALGGVLALGCAADAARRDWRRALPWLGGVVVMLTGLVVNFSRGGVLLFFGAVMLWMVLAAWERRSLKVLAVCGSALLVVVAAGLVAGGPLTERFTGGADSQVFFRWRIWRDTLGLVHDSPWCGAGLGNFMALFPFHRHASVIQQSVLHPESDWLWLATELGWLGVALVLVSLGFLMCGVFPLERGTQRRLRGAAFAAATGAALHGLVDVPAHRLGSVLVALLVLALARRDAAAEPSRDSRGAAVVWRALGLALIAAAVWWVKIPDDAARAETLSHTGHFTDADKAATRALARAPLDWGAYFTRAGARACNGQTLEALADFRRAKLLEPHYAGVPLAEGQFWVTRQPTLALLAWRETLRRIPPPEDEPLYTRMFDNIPDSAAFRADLLALAEGRPALQLTWFQLVPPAEAAPHIEEFTPLAEKCTPSQRAAFQRRAAELSGASK